MLTLLRKKINNRIGHWILQPLAKWYLAKDRSYSYKGLRLVVKSGVFHPGFFFSTKYLCEFVSKIDLQDKTFLELGAGSGLLSLVAARQGAIVTATDINPIALDNVRVNAQNNALMLETIYSDLFNSLPAETTYDYIFINPPYYPKNPQNDSEAAWYCGDEFQYFQKLFTQLPSRISNSACFMILSEDCDLASIQKIAKANGLDMTLAEKKRIAFEWNYIFHISKQTTGISL